MAAQPAIPAQPRRATKDTPRATGSATPAASAGAAPMASADAAMPAAALAVAAKYPPALIYFFDKVSQISAMNGEFVGNCSKR
jgi:hypothetical protein